MKPSERSQVEPFRVMNVMHRANALERQGHPVMHLEVGQPGTPAPRSAIAGVKGDLDTQLLGYTEALGRPALRARIARHYLERHGVKVAPERVVITTGSSSGFILAFLALFDAGQSIGIANPGYPAYRNIARALGLQARLIDCGAEDQFRLSAPLVAKSGPLDGLLLASPSNPCGSIIDEAGLRLIAGLCAERGTALISDEIYHGIAYERPAQTMLAVTQDAVVINSFSKYFSMTGWRIGWMVVPDSLVDAVERLAQNLFISAPAVSQVAALHAFDGVAELDGHVQVYKRNRDCLLAAMKAAGFGATAPADGAFYLYADISAFGLPASVFASRLLEEAHVAVTPGVDFDPVDGERWVRFSYAASANEIERAASALVGWCGTLAKVRGS